MNVAVIGLGSMGRRRIRLIKQYDENIKIIGIDLSVERRKQSEYELDIETNEDLEFVLKNKNIHSCFICTAPLSHNKIIETCLLNDAHVFTELNLVTDGYDENISLAKVRNKILFLSSTFLYREEVRKIKCLVEGQNKKLNYSYHIGQYLPDWHPWENYNDFFVGNKRTNGCREIFAIELPWLINTFGDIKDFKVIKSKISDLNVEYNDNYLLIIEHNTGNKGMLAVDVVSRKGVRNLEVFGEDLYLTWDGSANGLNVMNLENKKMEQITLYEDAVHLSNYNAFIIENAYLEEIKVFFESLENKVDLLYGFDKDKIVLDLIDKIEA